MSISSDIAMAMTNLSLFEDLHKVDYILNGKLLQRSQGQHEPPVRYPNGRKIPLKYLPLIEVSEDNNGYSTVYVVNTLLDVQSTIDEYGSCIGRFKNLKGLERLQGRTFLLLNNIRDTDEERHFSQRLCYTFCLFEIMADELECSVFDICYTDRGSLSVNNVVKSFPVHLSFLDDIRDGYYGGLRAFCFDEAERTLYLKYSGPAIYTEVCVRKGRYYCGRRYFGDILFKVR